MNYNFHPNLNENYQRMLNALLPGTYLRPHRHLNPPKSESFIVLSGEVLVLEFDDNGTITDHILLDAESGNFGVDLLPGTWHSIIALAPSVVFESKDGPYNPMNDKDFAGWAPAEDGPEAKKYIHSTIVNLKL
jgi:cupin fold WbuC family metalloprotein